MKTESHIISASRRTDIPAYYQEWFINRLKAGFCLVQNPFNAKQISRVSLLPENVTAFVFWTRNPQPFYKAIECLDSTGFKYGFLFTINGYPPELEPNGLCRSSAIEAFRQLSAKIGKHRMCWRYDPIIFSQKLDYYWHLKNFTEIACKLKGATERCIISFIDYYRKTIKNLSSVKEHEFMANPCSFAETGAFLNEIAKIANRNGLRVSACCETSELFKIAGISFEGCLSKEWIESVTGHKTDISKHKGQRKECLCLFSKDIGSYDTCMSGCRYCYATNNHQAVKMREHFSSGEKL